MKRNYFLLISMFLLSANCVWGQYSGGNGESSSTPYLISNLADLQTLASTVNSGTTYAGKYFELTADIKVNPDGTNLAGNDATTLLPIGTEKAPFTGNFDGKQHVVSNIKVVYNNSTMGDGGLGLFGKMNGGTLKNTGVNNIYIDAGTGQNAGGLIGRFDGTEMSNCFAEDVTIIGGHATYGGLIGKVWAPTISNCYVKNVSLGAGYGNSRGGFIANLTNGGATIINCYAMDLSFGEGTSDVIGLFCGKGEGGTINNCYVVQSDGKNYNFTHTTAGTTYKAGNTSVTENDLIKTKADFSGVAFAWNLNTTNNSTDNSGIWSHNGTYPIFADADHAAIYKTGYTYQQDTRSAQTYNATVVDGFTAIDLRTDADANIPSDILNNILAKGSANCLVYANNTITGKENNVIVSGSGKLELTDAASFYCPESFTATNATYTRNFAAGWNTFCLPFPIEKGSDDIEELVNGTDTYVQFDAPTSNTLPANTPYLINITASGNKTFSASGVTIPTSATMNDKSAGNYTFKACISPTTATSGYGLVLDATTGKEMFKKIPASGLEVPSFRAYLDATGSSNASLKILHRGGATEIASINAENTFKVFGSDNAIHVITDKAQNVSLFSIDGRLVKTVELSEGYNTIDGLLKGIYLINKQKVAVK